MINELKNVVAWVEAGGAITLGHLDSIPRGVATATDDAQCLAMLVQRKGESLDALLQRLDAAIADAYENGRALTAATTFEIDDVIDPAMTRTWIKSLAPQN